jgi:outer membrane murein-binding lipoprotein Lpp|tara:strand:- start:436 stop:621 length:186 start_codon:yes stop_codon:yes gene_type:complete
MEANINKLTSNYDSFSNDVDKFVTNGNAAAGTRARKALLEITKVAKELRKQIQEKKNEAKA